MENLRDLALTSGTPTLQPLLSPGQVQLSKVMDGSSWLHVQVCRDFLRGTCTFLETQCNFAHPQPHIKVRNNHINACYDNIKGTCNRNRPPCKYFHPPEHIMEELVVAGRQHLALKKALMQKMAAGDPGQPFNAEEVFEGETESRKPEIAMPNVQKREHEEESENKLNTKRCRYVEPSKRGMKEFIDQQSLFVGAVKVLQNASATECSRALVDTITKYEIPYENVVCVVTDGARYMTKCTQVRALQSNSKKVDILDILCGLKEDHEEFAINSIKAIWIPVSNVDSERAFSAYSNIMSDKRTNLKIENLETMLSLYFGD
uniref:C3H1-type domain-containing protein n=1 Tax=Timema bartmani TaxID=61472 RepID=A0A7R9I432_9NEOP|nr:unnamed protein product [Timema bartmani]